MKKIVPIDPLNVNDVKNIADILNENILNTYIQKVTQLSKDEYYFVLSKKNSGIFVSLRAAGPFLMLSKPTDLEYRQEAGSLEKMNYLLASTRIINIEAIKNDRIIKFTLERSTKSLDIEILYVYFELITNHPNIIVCDKNYIILYATKYSKKPTSARLIKQKHPYPYPTNTLRNSNVNTYKKENLYLLPEKFLTNNYVEIIIENNKDLYKYVTAMYTFYKQYVERAKAYLATDDDLDRKTYQANLLLTYKPKLEGHIVKVEDEFIEVDPFKTPVENAELMFKKIKKERRRRKFYREEIIPTYKERADSLSKLMSYLEEPNQTVVDWVRREFKKEYLTNESVGYKGRLPYYVVYDGVKIAFGKNAKQNDYLTFEMAGKNYHFFHIEGYSGAHVILFSPNPTDDQIFVAASIAILLSKKETAHVVTARVRDVKRTKKPGLVTVKNSKILNIDIKNAPVDVKKLLETKTLF